jgi:hypothetical protein
MIGIATTIFWIFLVIFCISAAYSAKDLSFDFKEPIVEVRSDNNLHFSMPITIMNRGFYDLGNFNITSTILASSGTMMTSGSTFVPTIPKGEAIPILHNMTLDLNNAMQNNQEYLFNDSSLMVVESVSMRIAEVIPIQASSNFTMPWGAPLYNFALGVPQYSLYNSTHSVTTIPISFENHAVFPVTGTIQIRMFGRGHVLLASGLINVDTAPNTPYSGQLTMYVLTSNASSRGRFEVTFSTSVFDYGPMVIPYG